MKKKIIAYYFILIIVGITIISLFVSRFSHDQYTHELELRLKTNSAVIAYNISETLAAGEMIDYQELALSYSALLKNSSLLSGYQSSEDVRVTFIGLAGNVIGESAADTGAMGTHLYRSEFKQAIQNGTGTDVRFSETIGVDYFYFAYKSPDLPVVIRLAVPMSQLNNIGKYIWSYSLIGIAITLLFATILAVIFASSLTRPIKELTKFSENISGGNYKQRVNVQTKDELGKLAAAFNAMSQELDSTIAELTEKNAEFDSIVNSMTNGLVAVDRCRRVILLNPVACRLFGIKDASGASGKNILEVIRNSHINDMLEKTVTSGEALTEELTIGMAGSKTFRVHTNPIASAEAGNSNYGSLLTLIDITNVKKLEKMRTDFVSNVTHELRTPLTSIRGFVETLRHGAVKNPEVTDKFLEIIDIEVERLTALINDILQLSEVESRSVDTNISKHNLKNITEEVINILQPDIDEKGIEVTLEIQSDIEITANRDRIKQMLINLTENAVKYNTSGGKIIIEAENTGKDLLINVSDSGVGIEEEHLARIFERFYRVDKGRSRSTGGTGLGLSIVKHIVTLYGGDVKVTSEYGKGTAFSIRLPQ